jgi:hypothetical protein
MSRSWRCGAAGAGEPALGFEDPGGRAPQPWGVGVRDLGAAHPAPPPSGTCAAQGRTGPGPSSWVARRGACWSGTCSPWRASA